MKNLILCFCISFYCIGCTYAQSDSLITELEKTLQAQIDSLGKEHLDIAMYCDSLGTMYIDAGKYAQADSLFTKALDIRAKKIQENHPDIADSYHNLGNVYYYIGDYRKAIKYYSKVLNIRLETLGERHTDTAKSYHNLGVVYNDTGDYKKAIKYHNKALNIRLEVLGEKHPKIAQSYNSIGIVYWYIGDYEKAINFYNKALNIRLEVLGEKHPKITSCYENLGLVYDKTGDYEKAISSHNKALNVWLDAFGEKHPYVATSYNNLGGMYSQIGDYEKAVSFCNKALNIKIDVLGQKHPSVGETYNNLGVVYQQTGNYEKAISFYNKALNIKIEVLGGKHPLVATSYNNLGVVYQQTGDCEKAISFYNKALNIKIDVLGQKHPSVGETYSDLGVAYHQTGDYEKAINFYNQALNIKLGVFGEKHPAIVGIYRNLAITYEEVGNYKTADSLWHIVINQNLKRLNDTYLFLPDNQRLEYVKTFEEAYNNFYSYTAKYGNEDTKRLAAYLSLNTKSLASDYAISVRKFISNTDDEELKTLHNKLNTLNKNISQAELMTHEEREEKNWELTAMRNQQENVAREILKNDILRKRLYKEFVRWEDTQSKLKPNEVILDFVRFHEESDSTWLYYAILTRKNMSAPQFIRITDQEAIAALLQAGNKNGQPNYIQNNEGLKTLYQKIWQPLTPYLKGIKTVHLSPSGLLHRIDFEVLQDENKDYLTEHFEFHYYTTMRDFTEKKKTNFLSKIFKKNKYKQAVFFGHITYDSPSKNKQPNTKDIIVANTLRDDIEPIPNTKEEILEAGKINKENGGQSTYITGNDATEDTVKYYSPDILHFATHGKYLSPFDSLGKQVTGLQDRLHISGNPLQRSMLMLSGANNTWTSNEYIPRSDKDGILTAYEVTHLDLSNTKLVVLSACNTGLGDIHDTEGVLGLQSAFKLAGVNHVVVSLWKVNDAATKELMVAFYKNLLTKKQDAPTALRNAKTEIRSRSEDVKPAHWAGFILIE